jgi:nitroimidazol reductase NimA-like FMN-containing flavoprotein (pyridoxamine 5'-phosphate oxidase superfamily)
MGSDEELTKIRRKERGKDDDWIRAFLAQAEFGTLATASDEQPFLVTRNFVYDEAGHAIYMHGAKKGRTYLIGLTGPRICFGASESGRLLPGKRAIDLGTEYSSVVIFGRLQVVKDAAEAKRGLQMLCEKYFPHLEYGQDYAPILEEDLKATAVLRIEVKSWSGKQSKAAADFPRAFYWSEVRDSNE